MQTRKASCLQVRILLIRQGHSSSLSHLLVVLIELSLVDLDLRWGKSRSSDEFELRIADEFSCQPEEGLFEVVVGLGGDIVVLEVLLAVESDGLGLDFALLDVDFVAGENDGDVFADADKITCSLLSAGFCSRFQSLLNIRCQLGTFLYVILDVTSNMMIPHWPLM